MGKLAKYRTLGILTNKNGELLNSEFVVGHS
jgi:hypothetical protein